MKITINRVAGGPVKLEDFANKHGLEMVVNERGLDMPPHMRYYANFKKIEIKKGAMLVSAFGNGATPEAAIEDYKSRIVGQRLVYSSYTPDRQEFDTPNEWLD